MTRWFLTAWWIALPLGVVHAEDQPPVRQIEERQREIERRIQLDRKVQAHHQHTEAIRRAIEHAKEKSSQELVWKALEEFFYSRLKALQARQDEFKQKLDRNIEELGESKAKLNEIRERLAAEQARAIALATRHAVDASKKLGEKGSSADPAQESKRQNTVHIDLVLYLRNLLKALEAPDPQAGTAPTQPKPPVPPRGSAHQPPMPPKVGKAGTPPVRVVVNLQSEDDTELTLSRKTYALKENQAKALADFLKAFARAKVMEIQVDGGKLTITTTPDVQATIRQVVDLMTGKRSDSKTTTQVRSQQDKVQFLIEIPEATECDYLKSFLPLGGTPAPSKPEDDKPQKPKEEKPQKLKKSKDDQPTTKSSKEAEGDANKKDETKEKRGKDRNKTNDDDYDDNKN